MKKVIIIMLSAALFFTAGGCGKKEGAANGKLIMATEAGFAPYEYTEDGEHVIGVDVDIANEIAKAMGKKLEIQNMTFEGVLTAVEQGKVDFGAAGLSVTKDRKKRVDFSIEYATSENVIVVNKDAGVVKSKDDIKKDTIVGVQLGNVADFYVNENLKCKKKQYSKFLEAAQELKNKKIDCIIMDSLPAKQLVDANKELALLEEPLFTDKYAIACKKGNKKMVDDINKVLQKLVDEGKIDEFTLNHTTK